MLSGAVSPVIVPVGVVVATGRTTVTLTTKLARTESASHEIDKNTRIMLATTIVLCCQFRHRSILSIPSYPLLSECAGICSRLCRPGTVALTGSLEGCFLRLPGEVEVSSPPYLMIFGDALPLKRGVTERGRTRALSSSPMAKGVRR
jgi:hypothetical protein